MIIIVVFILQQRCCWTTFVFIVIIIIIIALFVCIFFFFLLWVIRREMFECVTAALRGGRGCFGGPLTFNLPCFANGFSSKNVKQKMMGLRLWEVGRARESKFLQPTAAPGTSRRGLDLESDALLTTNHFTCGFLKLNDPRAGSQGKTGEAGTVDTLVIK